MIVNVFKILPSLVKMHSYVNSVSVFDRTCFVRTGRVSVTWKHYVLWKSNKRRTEAGSEMGLDKGKMSDRIQSGVFSVHPMSRCREPACTPTATVGFHKESVSIQTLIRAAEGPGIVTLHAKFQLVLVPVVSLEGGCHISETSTATFSVRLMQECHCSASENLALHKVTGTELPVAVLIQRPRSNYRRFGCTDTCTKFI